jgi:hypothetical protein
MSYADGNIYSGSRHICNCGGGGGGKGDQWAPTQYFFGGIRGGAIGLKRGKKKKNWGEGGGKGCLCRKDWFQPVFPLFLTPP